MKPLPVPSSPHVALHIERIVVDGALLPRGAGPRFERALANELTRMIANDPSLVARWREPDGRVSRALPALPAARATTEAFATSVAQAVLAQLDSRASAPRSLSTP